MSTDPGGVPRVNLTLVHAHGIAALVTLVVSVAFGALAAFQLVDPELGTGVPWLGWGRVRYAHTQGIMLGWLGNAFFAFLYHAVPILSGRPVTSDALGRWLFALWNFAVMAPGWVLVLAGVSQPLEWAEFPPVVDAIAVVGLGLAAAQFLPPFFARGLETLYVSSWYIIGALVFTLLAYPMGNLVPEFAAGAGGAAFSGLWIHDAVGLFVTPLALAIVYFVIPAASGRPIYSHFLSMLGFWLLFFLYPLNGTHHYVYSVIPMAAQLGAITASTLLGVDVAIVVANLLMSLRGSGWLPREAALRFVATSTVIYLIVSLQGSLQAQMAVSAAVHFSDWVVGHSHLAMMGFATFAGAGGLVHAWQRIEWARYNARAISAAYWLLVGGLLLMVADLTVAGLVQSRAWASGAPWIESVEASRPYWVIRAHGATTLVGAGLVSLLVGFTTGPRGGGRRAVDAAGSTEAEAPALRAERVVGRGSAVRKAYLVASVAGGAFFALSVGLLGVWPRQVIERQTATMAPPRPLELTASARRGRAVYAREGCAYCHTQQVRYLTADMRRFGRPTLAWEGRLDVPHLWGTRRIGPDLSRAAGTRSQDWHFAHLYSPRALVPASVMPAYASLFEGSGDRPRQAARDLVAYLETLGRAREIAAPEGEALARAACRCPDDEMALMAFDGELNAHPARPRRRGEVPPGLLELVRRRLAARTEHRQTRKENAGEDDRGRRLYLSRCAGCHGTGGRGDGPAAPLLRPRPASLVDREFAAEQLADALWNGVVGTAMPAWRDHAPDDLAAMAAVVRAFGGTPASPAPSARLIEIGSRVYAANCAQCHGERGDGNGWAASRLPVAPTDFRHERPALDRALEVLQHGIEGTSMAPWTPRLSENERLAVAHRVRAFYEGDTR